jgi:hypothetical protein
MLSTAANPASRLAFLLRQAQGEWKRYLANPTEYSTLQKGKTYQKLQ